MGRVLRVQLPCAAIGAATTLYGVCNVVHEHGMLHPISQPGVEGSPSLNKARTTEQREDRVEELSGHGPCGRRWLKRTQPFGNSRPLVVLGFLHHFDSLVDERREVSVLHQFPLKLKRLMHRLSARPSKADGRDS